VKLAAFFSGGKDSTYSILLAERMGHKVEFLVTFQPRSVDSYLFHYPNSHLTPLQAQAMNRRHYLVQVGEHPEEDVLNIVLRDISNEDVEGLVLGTVGSVFQRRRVEDAATRYGLTVITPLWGMEPDFLLKKILEEEFEVMIVGVAAAGLDESWLGRVIDARAVEELALLQERMGVHPAGEGGEIETLVLDCPLYKKKLLPTRVRKVWRTYYGYLVVEEAVLKDKEHSLACS